MSGGGILDADMATIRAWAGSGWRWWLDELAGMIPQRWRDARIERLACYAYDSESGELELLSTFNGIAPKPGTPIAVVLPAALTLIRIIEYPAVSDRDLGSLLELDRDRIMPQGRVALLAARVLTRDPASGRMQVEVAGLPLASARVLAKTFLGALRQPSCILVSPLDPSGAAPIDLLPALRRAGLMGTTDRSALPLWLAVSFLFLLNGGLLVWRDCAELDNLSAIVDQQQPAVSVAHRIIARMAGADRIATETITARHSREPVALMARIDRAIPAGTWIQRLNWQGSVVQLAGYHPARSDVSGALRRAGLTVGRYSDTSEKAPTPLGEPFEVTIRLGKP